MHTAFSTSSLLLVLISVHQFKATSVWTDVFMRECVCLWVKWRQAVGRLSDRGLRTHKHSTSTRNISRCVSVCVLPMFPLSADKPQMKARYTPEYIQLSLPGQYGSVYIHTWTPEIYGSCLHKHTDHPLSHIEYDICVHLSSCKYVHF